MAAKRAHDAAKAKAAKEKKILIGLAPVLVIAVFFAYHTMVKLHSPSPGPVSPAAATTPASTVAAATTPAATTPATATPASATSATATPVAMISTPAGGKLTRLSLFSAKDPFHDQGPRVSSSSTSSSSGSSSSSSAAKHPKSTPAKQSKSKPAKTPAAPAPTSAVIGVNGKLFDVPVGGTIPLSAAFGSYVRLKALTRKTATLGGRDLGRPVRLRVGSPVKLTDQAGHAYVIVLFPQGTAAPAAAAATTTPTTTTTSSGP